MTEARTLIDRDQIAAYLDMLFGYVEWEAGDEIRLRGIGEKGTDREGVFREPRAIAPLTEDIVARAADDAARWNAHRAGAFIVPAVMSGGDKEENVRLFTTLVVDLDGGDTDAKLRHLEHHVGPATMVVASGGVTETGQEKYHAYWRLNEPTDQVKRVGELRDAMALKVGDDPSFKRITQVIRIPGTTHGKNGEQRACSIVGQVHDAEHSLEEIAGAVNDMPYMRGVVPKAAPLANSGGLLDFTNREQTADVGKTAQALTETVRAGGVDGTTRWDSFNQVAGHYLHCARRGDSDVQQARELAHGWMLAHMQPPWPDQRFEDEWRRLLDHDVRAYGPMTPPAPVNPMWQAGAAAAARNMFDGFAASDWVPDDALDRQWLVKGLIAKGEPHLLVAPGGAGKTFTILDLAFRIALGREGRASHFWGREITDHAGGTVVVITTEDSRRELAIRIQQIDHNGVRKQLGTRLVIYPTVSVEGGAFTVCERDARGNVGPSRQWQKIVEDLTKLEDLKLVIVDTLNAVMHGDENSATTMNEFRRAAFRLCAEDIGVAVMFTHHVRKTNPQNPVRDKESMLAAVRGSGALTAAFRIVIGMWEPPDADKRLAAMGITHRPGRLWFAQIVKANIHECHPSTITLVRNEETGLLLDMTARDVYRTELRKQGGDEHRAWLLAAIRRAVLAGHPYTTTGMNSFMKRKGELPPQLHHVSDKKWRDWINEMVEQRALFRCSVPGTKLKGYLDVEGGPLFKAQDRTTGGEYATSDGGYAPAWSQWEFFSPTGEVVEIGKKDAA